MNDMKENTSRVILILLGFFSGLAGLIYIIYKSGIVNRVKDIFKGYIWINENEVIFSEIYVTIIQPVVKYFAIWFVIVIIALILKHYIKKLEKIWSFVLMYLFGYFWLILLLFAVVVSLLIFVIIICFNMILTIIIDYLTRPIIIELYDLMLIVFKNIFGFDYTLATKLEDQEVNIYFWFLIFVVILPYSFKLSTNLLIKILSKVNNKEFVKFILKPLSYMSINIFRSFIYLFLFIIYQMTNIVEVSGPIVIVRESLLAFVLCDVVVYLIYSKFHELKCMKIRNLISFIIDDLEAIVIELNNNKSYINPCSIRIKYIPTERKKIEKLCKLIWNDKNVYYIENDFKLLIDSYTEYNNFINMIIRTRMRLISIQNSMR